MCANMSLFVRMYVRRKSFNQLDKIITIHSLGGSLEGSRNQLRRSDVHVQI